MIVYNETGLDNLLLNNLVEAEKNTGCITEDEAKAIKQKYPVGFYMPGIFIRIGLFILTFIIVLFSAGLLSLILIEAHLIDSFGWPLFLGLLVYIALEMMVTRNNYYKSGVDDALLWMAAGLITGAFMWWISDLNFTNTNLELLIMSLFVFILSSFFTLRFADTVMSAVASLSAFAVVYFGWQFIGGFGVAALPFIMILVSALVYLAARRSVNTANTLYYADCLLVIQLLSLLVLYLAGNYYIVSELSNQLNGAAATGGKPIPLGFFFWGWTMLIPFVYVAIGIKRKSGLLLRAGLLLIAAAVVTFRYYYHIIPTDLALTIGGVIILAIMYGVVKYLKNPKHGITCTDTKNSGMLDKLKIESLITAGTFAHIPATSAKPADRFGGGSFGGGGSSDNY